MKKFLTAFLSLIGVIGTTSAQLANFDNGYYRVNNAYTDRYIYVMDNTGSIDLQKSSADMAAIVLKKDLQNAISDPASVLYFEKHGNQYDIQSQSTGIYQMIGMYVNLMESRDTDNAYWAYGSKSGITLYLYDATPNPYDETSYLVTTTTDPLYRNWYVNKIDNSTDNYFGVKPTHSANGKHYASFYADFPFSCASSGMKVYCITTVDEAKGQVVYKEITGTVPRLTPVIIECSSTNPADNKLNIGGDASAVSGCLGTGVLFEFHKHKHDNYVTYNKSTMRTIGVASDGSIAMTAGDYTDVPKNTFYIPVSSSAPSSLRLVSENEYQADPVDVTSVSLNKNSLNLNIGDSETLVATVNPSNATDKTVTWSSSNSAVATVDANGKVTAVAHGSAVITANASGKTATCNVTVNPILATSVTLSASSLSLEPGQSQTLVATVAPDNTSDKTVTWTSSNPAVATVSANGTVTALTPGSAVITAACGSVSATCAVTVNAVPAVSISLDRSSVEMHRGESVKLSANVLPANATDKTVTWASSNSAVATVSSNGTVTAVALGEAVITASCGDLSASCTVTVSPVDAASIVLSQSALHIGIGESVQIEATVLPENTEDKTVTWSTSDASIATVDANGVISGIASGSAVITAACGSVSAICEVVVSATEAESISLDVEALEMHVGDEHILVATILPSELANKNVKWKSSNTSVALVSSLGRVTAVGVGDAEITATVDNVSAVCKVRVVPTPVESIALDVDELEIEQGLTYQLVATVLPENATDKTITWTSSDASVASVDANGLLTAVAEGSAVITASCGELSASCNVYVEAGNTEPFESIDFTGTITIQIPGMDTATVDNQTITISQTSENTCTLALYNFSLGGEPIGDIVIQNVAVVEDEANNSVHLEGAEENLLLAGGTIRCSAQCAGDITDEGVMSMVINVLWMMDETNVLPIVVTFNGSSASISSVEVDNDAPEVYYDLNGVRFNGKPSAPGIYIVTKGNKASKVYLK